MNTINSIKNNNIKFEEMLFLVRLIELDKKLNDNIGVLRSDYNIEVTFGNNKITIDSQDAFDYFGGGELPSVYTFDQLVDFALIYGDNGCSDTFNSLILFDCIIDVIRDRKNLVDDNEELDETFGFIREIRVRGKLDEDLNLLVKISDEHNIVIDSIDLFDAIGNVEIPDKFKLVDIIKIVCDNDLNDYTCTSSVEELLSAVYSLRDKF